MGLDAKHAYRFGFLKSEEWEGIRLTALAANGAKCFICGKIDWSNDAHHVRYPKRWKETQTKHLRILCRKHHELVHSIMKMYPRMEPSQVADMIRRERDDFWRIVDSIRKRGKYVPFEIRWERLFFWIATKKLKNRLTELGIVN